MSNKKKVLTIVNSLNYDPGVRFSTTIYPPSITVPDQSLGLKETIARHARGLPITASEAMYSGGETEYPNLATMDLSEIADYRRSVQEYTVELQTKLKKEQQEQTQKILEKRKQEKQSIFDDFKKWYDDKKTNATS